MTDDGRARVTVAPPAIDRRGSVGPSAYTPADGDRGRAALWGAPETRG
jgi:hypothetical protein